MGAGGSPCGVARAGGFAVGPALATPQGLPTAPNMGGAEGDLQGACSSPALRKNERQIPPKDGCLNDFSACSGDGRLDHSLLKYCDMRL